MKKRRTREEKLRSAERKPKLQINFDLYTKSKSKVEVKVGSAISKNHLRADLTKVLVLTMLALALEVGIMIYLKR